MSVAQTVSKNRKQSLRGASVLQYPSEELTHFMMMYFTKPERGTIFRTKRPSFKDIPRGSIILPIPANLQESYKVNYEGSELGSLIGAGGQAAADALAGKGLAGLQDVNLSTIGKAVGRKIVEGIDAGIVRAGEKYLGEIFNPHLTSVFRGIDLRNHQFTWKVSPRNESESLVLKNIFDTVRNKMLPPTFDKGIRMGYPDEVFIRFYGDAYNLYPIFRCVVTGFNINHAAAGTPVFYGRTGMPAELEFSIDLQEVEIITRNDFPGADVNDPDPTSNLTTGSFVEGVGQTVNDVVN